MLATRSPFINEIDKGIGFWPAEPDFFNLERGLIDEPTYMEQLERLADYQSARTRAHWNCSP